MAALARKLKQPCTGNLGRAHPPPRCAHESCANKPGAYFVIGNGDGTHREGGHGLGPCTLHNPSYDFNDELIPLGGTLWVKLAQRWLAQP